MNGASQPNQKYILADIAAKNPKSVADTIVAGMLSDEYRRLEAVLQGIRQRYLSLDVDDPASEHEIADLRIEALEAYQPAYTIESWLTERDVDIGPLLPQYRGEFETSAVHKKGWDLSFVSLKEGAMRSLGGHCNVIGEVVMLERRLYHHTYLAAVMQPAGADEGKKPAEGEDVELEFHFSTVVFDEDVNALV
ncbi:MAG: hypothetical protein A4E28_02507 [Methanocella sp. PtaU1.Bin125]|nr:MAG: hypothetical protein A4E28_02507 [Methanocella sp. PtaU1.Bin125]